MDGEEGAVSGSSGCGRAGAKEDPQRRAESACAAYLDDPGAVVPSEQRVSVLECRVHELR